LAAALALGESATSTGAPILGQAPGRLVNCGGGAMCLGARWSNPFRSGTFRAGWSLRQGGLLWRPRLVTMLHGRSAADAARLIASATTAEALGGARGTFMFMDGADGARGVLDGTYDGVLRGLRALGFTDVVRVPFQGDLEGQSLAAFFVGTAGLGRTIEGNRFAPGALVDNLTSFGAVAENFRASGEQSQVSIARWVAQGVAGVHGTTDEPLNNCFPSRDLVVSYAEGGTLGEAYFRAMPFVYWHNLVLGDPMAAPYAVRPRVRLEGVADDDVVVGSRLVTATAEDPLGRTLDALVLYVDGEERARSAGEPLSLCLEAGRHVLAVAQVADERTPETRHRPKGWARRPAPLGGGRPAGLRGARRRERIRRRRRAPRRPRRPGRDDGRRRPPPAPRRPGRPRRRRGGRRHHPARAGRIRLWMLDDVDAQRPRRGAGHRGAGAGLGRPATRPSPWRARHAALPISETQIPQQNRVSRRGPPPTPMDATSSSRRRKIPWSTSAPPVSTRSRPTSSRSWRSRRPRC
jgi:hypothetical protein